MSKRQAQTVGPLNVVVSMAVSAALIVSGALIVSAGPDAWASPSVKSLTDGAQCGANRSIGTITYVSPFGYDASAGILDVFAAQRLGYFGDMCLKVAIVANSEEPYELVSAGTAQVSNIGSAADDLGEVADGADMEAVATYGDVSDYALLTQPGVTSLKQLDGKILAYHTAVPLVILEMLHSAGVELSSLDTVDTQDYDPNQLLQGHEEALQAYQSNEPLTLRAEGARFTEYVPRQFGIKGTFNVEVFNRPFSLRHPLVVADFMRAQLHAFYYCAAHEVTCVKIEQHDAQGAGASYDFSHEISVWKLESALAKDHTLEGAGVGVESRAEWQPEAAALLHYGILKSVPKLDAWENTSIVASLYRGKTLIWP